MTATYSDEITNIISNLRSTIYNSEEFVRKFTEYMNRNGICNVGFGYDPTGGINIYITIENYNPNDTKYFSIVSSALEYAINEIGDSAIDSSIVNNLANIIYVGNNTLMVKI